MKTPATKFGEYRRRHHLTQKRLAEKLHISQNYVCDLERGVLLPTPAVANAAAAYFGVKVEALFPDGIRHRYNYNNAGPHREEARYLPPTDDDPRIVVHRLDACPKCGASGFFEHCYACGKPLVVEEVVAP